MNGGAEVVGRRTGMSWAALVAAVLVLCHVSAVLHVYGYNDDYHVLYDVQTRQFDTMRDTLTRDGRFLTAALVKGAYRAAGNVEGLRWVRASAVVFIAAGGAFLFALLLRGGFTRRFAASLSIIVFATPAFAVYSSWAVTFTYPLAVILAMVAGVWTHGGIYAHGGSVVHRAAVLVAATFLTVVVYWIYQPLAFFGLFAVAVLVWRDLSDTRAALLRFSAAVGLFFFATVLYKASYDFAAAHIFDLPQSHRAGWVDDYIGKVAHLAGYAYPAMIGNWPALWGKVPAYLVTMAVTGVVAAGTVVSPEGRRMKVFAAGVLFVLSTFTFALSRENFIAHRLYAGGSAWVLFLAWVYGASLLEWARRALNNAWVRPLRTILPGVVVGLFILSAVILPWRHIHAINAGEYAAIRELGREELNEMPDRLSVVLPAHYERTMADVTWAEFRTRSSHMPWVAPKMFQLALFDALLPALPVAEAAALHPGFELFYALGDPADRGGPTINLFERIHRGDTVSAEHPAVGVSRRVTHLEFYHSDWFGVFDSHDYPSVYHLGLGWIYVDEVGDDGRLQVYLMGFDERKAVISPDSFPRIFFPEEGRWLLFDPYVGYRGRFRQAPPAQ